MKFIECRKATFAKGPVSIVSRLPRHAPAFPCRLCFFPWLLFFASVMLQGSHAAAPVRLEKIAEFRLRAAPTAADWNVDGSLLAVVGLQSSLAIWNSKTSTIVLNESYGRIRFGAVKFSPNGQWLATGREFTDESSSLWLFNTSSWKRHDVSSARPLRSTDSLCFTHDGSRVVAAAAASRTPPLLISVMDATNPTQLQRRRDKNFVKDLACHPLQPIVAVGRTAALLEFYDTNTGDRIGSMHAFDSNWWWIQKLEFSQDGRFLFTGSNSGMAIEKLNRETGKIEKKDRGEPIKMWDGTTLKLLRVFGDREGGETFLESSVRSLSHSARDGLLLAGFDGGKIRAWDIETGEERITRSEWSGAVIAKFNHDGSRLAVADQGSHSVIVFKISVTH